MAGIAASLIPTSPTQLVFGKDEPSMTAAASSGKEDGGSSSEGKADGGGADEGKGPIQPKEFFWDQFIIYVSTVIALLTVLDVTLQFFRGGGLACRVPGNVEDSSGNLTAVTRDDVVYINTFCQQSLTRAEYYPFFVLIQGLVLAAPQYIWASLFVGQFDFLFGLVQQLDRLRSRQTGKYRPKNFEIVNKLEKQFPREWKWRGIFFLYIVKLSIQLFVVVVAIIINGAVFQDSYFNFVFKCPKDLDPTPEGWWWPSLRVTCVFSSFRLHKQLRSVHFFLLCLALLVITYGLWWCFARHVNALGYKDNALFAFSSCLKPSEFVEERFFKKPFSPRIRNDMDFLLMRLFRADSGHGLVFKDIQVSNLFFMLIK